MNAQEKAKALVDKYEKQMDEVLYPESLTMDLKPAAKACAIIACDLLFEQLDLTNQNTPYDEKYWTEVKNQINLL